MRQVEVLQWIGDGTPQREWPDWSHRITAKALQSRGLVKVRGHGASWTATITDRGRRVLAGEEDPTRKVSRTTVRRSVQHAPRQRGRRPGNGSAVRMAPEDLAADLIKAAGSTVTVVAPDDATRSAYRQALAAMSGVTPPGKRVRYTGRDRGDLIIRLVDAAEPGEPDPRVPVPVVLDLEDPLVSWLSFHPDRMDVAEGSRDRALKIVQASVNALAARGHEVARPRPAKPEVPAADGRNIGSTAARPVQTPSKPATFQVQIGDEFLLADLYEERARVKTAQAGDAAKVKYDWQRVTPMMTWQFDGRLALRIRDHTASRGWADSKRWTLESRLPRFVRNLEEVARERTNERRRLDEARRQRRREWEAALPQARTAYLQALNRGRLNKQLEAFTRAEQLRAYADAVDRRAAQLENDDQAAARAWAKWIRAEASRCDPTSASDALMFSEPDHISPWDLDKYMPHGWSASRPPDDPN